LCRYAEGFVSASVRKTVFGEIEDLSDDELTPRGEAGGGAVGLHSLPGVTVRLQVASQTAPTTLILACHRLNGSVF
jgi:hypothetical protein